MITGRPSREGLMTQMGELKSEIQGFTETQGTPETQNFKWPYGIHNGKLLIILLKKMGGVMQLDISKQLK